jgi:anti-anti-sigma regulatory factor
MRVIVQSQPDIDPDLSAAPTHVVVRPGALTCDDVSQLRRVLHDLIGSAPRTVTVDLSDVDVVRRTNVVAVLVGAAREARSAQSTVRVYNPPLDQRRALFVAGIDECAHADAAYEVVIGTLDVAVDDEPVAV